MDTTLARDLKQLKLNFFAASIGKSLPFLFLLLILTARLHSKQTQLFVPPIIKGSKIELNIQRGVLELPTGKTKTLGYNGNYLGPTIMVEKGENVSFLIKNKLKENTTLHWHGLLVPAVFDGGPRQVIEAGDVWEPHFEIVQPAATLWYHPHLLGKTAEHVYKGLAGMFYIADDYSKSLDIPKEYGVNDFPLILQDRAISRNGRFVYRPTMHEEMFGYIGNTLLVNGAVEPSLEIEAGTYRFRILNGSNSSLYKIRFAGGKRFTVIASDGGFLPKSKETKELIISPGERFEILIDFKKKENATLIADIYNGDSFKALRVITKDRQGEFYAHPKEFDYQAIKYDRNRNQRATFVLQTQRMGRFAINGRQMSMDRIDYEIPVNTTEIWRIENRGFRMMQTPHSFHVHDVQFSVISVNGKKAK